METKKLVFAGTTVNQNKCLVCGEWFMVSDKEKDQQFCSRECGFNDTGAGKSKRELVGVELRIDYPEFKWQRKIGDELRMKIYNRDGFTCYYCGYYIEDQNKLNELTIDHILPITRGGDNSEDNLITCCRVCNSHKSNRKFRNKDTAKNWLYNKLK